MPEKPQADDLEKKLLYCKLLEKEIESDIVLSSLSRIKEQLNLLKETLEDTQERYTLRKIDSKLIQSQMIQPDKRERES